MGYSYSAPQWLLVFFLYCVLGWCFETTVVSVKQRHFVNRGFLRGPMLPIYGFGAVLLLHVSLPLYDRPAALFFREHGRRDGIRVYCRRCDGKTV